MEGIELLRKDISWLLEDLNDYEAHGPGESSPYVLIGMCKKS